MNKVMVIVSVVVLAAAFTAFGGQKLVIDTDMGLDDARAITALAVSEKVDIVAVITVDGSVPPGKGAENVLKILDIVHAPRIPVSPGRIIDGLTPPPWRDFAASLGGASPPESFRDICSSQGTELLENSLERSRNGVILLTLGPLTNIAAVLKDRPELQDKIECIVMIGLSPEYTGWNVRADPGAAERILSSDMEIYAVTETICDRIAFDEQDLEKLKNSGSPAGRFVFDMVRHPGGDTHFPVWDEVAAAWIMDGTLINFKPWVRGGKKEIMISSDIDVERTKELLLESWTGGNMKKRTMEMLKNFHGHLGPYVVIGYRAGELAKDLLGTEGYFDMKATVKCPLEPPKSCFIDGIQIGSGCTAGKANLTVEKGETLSVRFISKSGRKLSINIKPDFAEKIPVLIEESGVEEAGEKIMGMEPAEMFAVGK